MVLKITTWFIIVVASSLIVFSVMRFVADMQMQVVRVAWVNKEIKVAYIYTKKAIAWNPTELKYYEQNTLIMDKYKQLKKIKDERNTK
jgi:hypothetical protein